MSLEHAWSNTYIGVANGMHARCHVVKGHRCPPSSLCAIPHAAIGVGGPAPRNHDTHPLEAQVSNRMQIRGLLQQPCMLGPQ